MLKRLLLNPGSVLKSMMGKLRNIVAEGSSPTPTPETSALAMMEGAATEAAETDPTTSVEERPKRPKGTRYAVLLGFQGKNYLGMQVQPKGDEVFPTIESKLLGALKDAGFITEEQQLRPGSFQFQRAARTDKGVSGVRQMCSMMLPRNPEFTERGPEELNARLPDDIRVFGIRRTVPSFHAWKMCEGRTYSYTLPTFSFAEVDKLTDTNYRMTEARIAEIDDLLLTFLGTHNFFNYTARIEHHDQRCRRHIISFKCDKPFIYRDEQHGVDVEFITVYIRGQSFMMHQIRKMMGAIISIARGFMYKSDLQRSFEKDRMDIPKAPANGLLLEQLHYERYEKRFGLTHDSLTDWGEEVERLIQETKQRLIVSNILRNECEAQVMMEWLSNLSLHRFICDAEAGTEADVTKLHDANVKAYTMLKGEPPLEEVAAAEEEEEAGVSVADADSVVEEPPLKKMAGEPL